MSKRRRTSAPKPALKRQKTMVLMDVDAPVRQRAYGRASFGEMKYFDTERAATDIPASTDWTATEFPPNVGTPTTICVPTVGAAINQRIGREVKVHKIKVRGIITCAAQTAQTTADNPAQVRLLLVQDTRTNSAQAQGEDIMQAPTTAAATHVVSSFQSLANLGRFKVLKDQTILLQDPNMAGEVAATNVIQAGLNRPFKLTITFKKPVSVRFNNSAAGTIADVIDNSWCLYAAASSTGLVPRILYNARACYKE